jgi:CheY-like chemotaxis protein
MEPMLRRLVAANIGISIGLRPDLSGVRTDPGQLEQVIMNLVINAADAMPSGGQLAIETSEVLLDAEYARQHAGMLPGRYVALVVSDTGTGMDDATRARIFDPFFTTKPAGVGTGLGLATVYGIVRQSHGYIWVYSVMGHGTTFKVHFPAVAADGLLVWQAGNETAIAERGTETILLVEDEPAVRESTRRILIRHGYTVLVAGSGTEALRISAEHAGTIDLVISDLMMPDLGGRELAEQLRSRRPHMRLLFMSGYTDDDVRRRGLLELADEFIQKPFSFDELTRRVRELLDAARDSA